MKNVFHYSLFYLKRKKASLTEVKKDKRPAHIIALEQLQKLTTEQLWQQGKVKLYYTELTDILRQYIENRYHIPALEQVTHQIIKDMKNASVSEQSLMQFKEILELADLVKFAKAEPLQNENELCLKNALEFVEKTKLIFISDEKLEQEKE